MLTCFRAKGRQLDLSRLNLQSEPSCISNLTQLESLRLNFNHLTEINGSIVNLTELVLLFLDHNQLSSFPIELLRLRDMSEVSLLNNPFLEEVLNQLMPPIDSGPLFYTSRTYVSAKNDSLTIMSNRPRTN